MKMYSSIGFNGNLSHDRRVKKMTCTRPTSGVAVDFSPDVKFPSATTQKRGIVQRKTVVQEQLKVQLEEATKIAIALDGWSALPMVVHRLLPGRTQQGHLHPLSQKMQSQQGSPSTKSLRSTSNTSPSAEPPI